MNKWTLICLFTLLALTVQAQKNKILFYELDLIHEKFFQPNTIEPFSGTAYEEFPGGKKKMNVPIKAGKINGTVREWAQNGKKVYEANYVNGVQTGKEMQWYANGAKKLEISYQSGKAEGICTEWFKNGNKKSEGLFRNGGEEGEHQWWYDDGQKDQIVQYVNGLTEGTVNSWHQNGQQRLMSNYNAGKQHGEAKEWYANGQLKLESAYVDGLEHGEFQHWSPKGKLLGIKVYEKGKTMKDLNYRSGSIRINNGFIQVFNEQKSFFTLEIVGNAVSQRKNEDITYAVDGKLLQLFNTAVINFHEKEAATLSEAELLQKFVDFESAYIQEMTKTAIEVQAKPMTTKAGKAYLYWQFVSPSSKDKEQKPRTVQQEHYISLVCGQRILSLYSVVTNSDEPQEIELLLKRLAEKVSVEKERIDLNSLARAVQDQ